MRSLTGAVGDMLVCYSNPGDSGRIRLDLEHRMIYQEIEASGIDPRKVTLLQATTSADIATALSQRQFSLVQFSGHGTADGVYVEGLDLGAGEELSATALCHLLQSTAPELEAILCMSCFSSNSIGALLPAAQLVITVTGEASDAAVIEFLRVFYKCYFRKHSLPEAFAIASSYLEMRGKNTQLNTVMTRRAEGSSVGRTLIHVAPHAGGSPATLVLDITDVESDIASLGVPRDTFLSILSRKIRVHRFIFAFPRERAMLQMGQYFGEFSWKSPNDIVVCHKVLALKSDVDEELCSLWARLIVEHNDAYVNAYRLTPPEALSSSDSTLATAVANFKWFPQFITAEDHAARLRAAVPAHYTAVRAQIVASIALAEDRLARGDKEHATVHLEVALSAVHDLINALTDVLTIAHTS